MKKSELKQRFEELTEELSENKLKVLIDFANQLKNGHGHENDEFLQIQINSNSYREWTGSENDIYDEVFRDDIK